ncbi:hypothetical protein DXG01_006302 [Tephrocybe rancida]|nr:hypothetical protein DXG01_006302 [Tephrocybe rancida]
MASFLQQLLKGLTPPPHINLADYDGLQYKWSIFVFRPALFQLELYLLGGLVAFLAVVLTGIHRNKAKATKWHNAYLPVLEKQFSKPLGQHGLAKDGNSDFYTFSTGRRNIASLHTVFTLRPRHDPFQYLFQFGRTLIDLHYRPKDDVTLDFKLAPGALAADFVWAVVAKEELLSIKNDRWDLRFMPSTDLHQDERVNLSASFALGHVWCVTLPAFVSDTSSDAQLVEFADVTDNLLKPALVAALRDPKVLPYFRSLSVTDQPRDRPEAPLPVNKRQKHVILSLSLSSGCVEDAADLVSALFPFIDTLNAINLRPETRSKLKRTREELDKSLKADSEREKKEEETQAAEDKKAAKRQVEQERIAKLPAAEQQKILEKERKRNLRKSQGKVVRK